MRVGVLGINHKLADLHLREKLAKACQRRFGVSQFTQTKTPACVLLSTCNRTEIYFSSHDLADSHSFLLSILRQEVGEEFEHKLYSYFGNDCFTHLVRVSSGLDSAIIAETEIQGQVKTAYVATMQHVSLPEELHFLFQKGLKTSKDIRSQLDLGRGMPNLEHAVFNIGNHFFKEKKDFKMLFVGASEINQKILGYMNERERKNLTICNRSLDHAKEVANKFQADILHWDCVSEWHHFDWIIFGTKSPDFLVRKNDIPQSTVGQKLIIDLSVPRNVEPCLGRDQRVTLLNIDQINRTLQFRKKHLHRSLALAEEMIFDSAKRYTTIFQQKELSKLRFLAVGA